MNWSQIVTGSKCGVELMAEENTQKTGLNVGANEQKLLNLIAKDSAVTAITASEVLSIGKCQIERLLTNHIDYFILRVTRPCTPLNNASHAGLFFCPFEILSGGQIDIFKTA